MPGRIVGQSLDADGKIADTLTLSTREQHIRRHRATSNICSNETLIALMGAMHMSLLGPEGLERLAMRVTAATQTALEAVTGIAEVELIYPESPVFREFAVRLPCSSRETLERMDSLGVTGGFDLSQWWETMDDCLLIGCDERTTRDDIEMLTSVLAESIRVKPS